MTQSFIVPVAFKRVTRTRVDTETRAIATGTTRDGKVFGVFALVADVDHPQMQVTIDDGRMLRVGLATLVQSLIDRSTEKRPLPEDLAEHLDHVRAALAGMKYREPRGTFSGLDVFGEALEAIERFAANWEELPDVVDEPPAQQVEL